MVTKSGDGTACSDAALEDTSDRFLSIDEAMGCDRYLEASKIEHSSLSRMCRSNSAGLSVA